MAALTVADLAAVVYSSGKVFDGLSTGRLDTENFLRSGSLDGVASRADLALLEDLLDAAQFVIDHAGRTIDSDFVRAVNATITRSGALHPGQLRTRQQAIGVGRHTPDALTEDRLQALLDQASTGRPTAVGMSCASAPTHWPPSSTSPLTGSSNAWPMESPPNVSTNALSHPWSTIFGTPHHVRARADIN